MKTPLDALFAVLLKTQQDILQVSRQVHARTSQDGCRSNETEGMEPLERKPYIIRIEHGQTVRAKEVVHPDYRNVML